MCGPAIEPKRNHTYPTYSAQFSNLLAIQGRDYGSQVPELLLDVLFVYY